MSGWWTFIPMRLNLMSSKDTATRHRPTIFSAILGGTGMTLVMSAALAADGVGSDIMPLPPRPDTAAVDVVGETEDGAKALSVSEAGETLGRNEKAVEVAAISQSEAGGWRTQQTPPQPKVILSRPGVPLASGPFRQLRGPLQQARGPLRQIRGPLQQGLGPRRQARGPLLQGQQIAGPSNGAWPMIILAAGEPVLGQGARKVEFDNTVFKSDPAYEDKPYEQEAQIEIYGGKTAVDPQRPIVELGEPFYDVGPLGEGTNVLGGKNLVFGHLFVFGDWRTAVAYNDNGNGLEVGQIATRANLDVDLGLTATERLHALFQPLQEDGQFTRCEFAGDASIDDCELELDYEPQTAFFEGDLGAITAGLTGSYNGVDLPFTGGLIPLIFQNGVWLEDAFIGGAAALPSLNSPALDISNADITVFAGFDKVTAPGVIDAAGNVADSNVNIYGIATFVETLEGFIEAGYAYIDAEDALEGQDYHSITAAITKRYGGWLSNSLRVAASFGQDEFGVDGAGGDEQNGAILLSENSLITSKPYTLLPYVNLFVGFGRPVPAADATGFLRNTGINFESDALTGFPFLDDTGQNAYGGAIGVQYLFDLQQQLVFEVAATRDLDDFSNEFDSIVQEQYAAGVRYQIPLSNAWLFRADAIYAYREALDDDVFGVRSELRFKF